MWLKGALLQGNIYYRYEAKVYDTDSQYGIDGGRISKMEIRRGNRIVCSYDRGWNIKPVDEETENVLQQIMEKYR